MAFIRAVLDELSVSGMALFGTTPYLWMRLTNMFHWPSSLSRLPNDKADADADSTVGADTLFIIHLRKVPSEESICGEWILSGFARGSNRNLHIGDHVFFL